MTAMQVFAANVGASCVRYVAVFCVPWFGPYAKRGQRYDDLG